MTNATIGWCDKCNKEVSLDHDCMRIMRIHKLKDALENTKEADG